MPGLLTKCFDLAEALHRELVKEGHWEGLKTISVFAKAEEFQALEKRIRELEDENRLLSTARADRDWFVKRFKKLDAVHSCQCEECSKHREKASRVIMYQVLTDIKSIDKENKQQ
jgi:hypothetical protein